MSTISSPGVLILSAPSGAGKTSLAHALVACRGDAEITVSHTTRKQRPGEIDGEHYNFVDQATFKEMIENHEFIEFAQVFDHFYGTSIKAIDKLILNGKHAILDIDWQGARIVREKYPDAVSVFVMPPSIADLKKRLTERKQDSEETISKRMQEASNEMSHKDEFDIIIVNDNFSQALAELGKVVDELGTASM